MSNSIKMQLSGHAILHIYYINKLCFFTSQAVSKVRTTSIISYRSFLPIFLVKQFDSLQWWNKQKNYIRIVLVITCIEVFLLISREILSVKLCINIPTHLKLLLVSYILKKKKHITTKASLDYVCRSVASIIASLT